MGSLNLLSLLLIRCTQNQTTNGYLKVQSWLPTPGLGVFPWVSSPASIWRPDGGGGAFRWHAFSRTDLQSALQETFVTFIYTRLQVASLWFLSRWTTFYHVEGSRHRCTAIRALSLLLITHLTMHLFLQQLTLQEFKGGHTILSFLTMNSYSEAIGSWWKSGKYSHDPLSVISFDVHGF